MLTVLASKSCRGWNPAEDDGFKDRRRYFVQTQTPWLEPASLNPPPPPVCRPHSRRVQHDMKLNWHAIVALLGTVQAQDISELE
jgi:hypothetical protein